MNPDELKAWKEEIKRNEESFLLWKNGPVITKSHMRALFQSCFFDDNDITGKDLLWAKSPYYAEYELSIIEKNKSSNGIEGDNSKQQDNLPKYNATYKPRRRN